MPLGTLVVIHESRSVAMPVPAMHVHEVLMMLPFEVTGRVLHEVQECVQQEHADMQLR